MPDGPGPDVNVDAGAERDAQRLAGEIVAAVEELYLSAEDRIARRLARAETSVALHLTDVERAGLSLYFDGETVSTEREPREDCEIHMYMTARTLLDVFLGNVNLTMAIPQHKVTYHGPVRRYLTISPCHRRLDFTPFSELLRTHPELRRNHQRPVEPAPASHAAESGEGR